MQKEPSMMQLTMDCLKPYWAMAEIRPS